MNVQKYWQAVLRQQPDKIKPFFHEEAYINWHNTNERFTVDEFVKANCEYPGKWDGTIEKVVEKDNVIITVVCVFSQDKKTSFHVTSFITIEGGKIISLDEYWGGDGKAPQWRLDMHIGKPIE
ncbi:MAG: nuclear transport factor 2 family protein [Treponema sp.]